MKKLIIIFIFALFATFAYAENYSEMSTQELISIMGYVDKKNQTKFENELKSRISTMTPKEKTMYQNNLKKMKK
ncbi:DUF1104 domain-containing protein [Halarcobacter bivalviorum]|uniref:DUF1104 domain-containing protein n=1 Tax=Halarcobacter bivalviorum TaxID=663364 RepID=A0AAX2A9P6_9BACT|nr:DUF1104 domain-containing protein [Halarcobacter bivalviorum]AXH12460.1 hypothetical protein ABIV_1465 [Halarcobacter bivalviorum]RXK07909.1 DUF1104 domain-containing protein [Halarcobacter bivalviorum]RXK10614.1 DUF1104 domain-containing protein [Halarcobacter bivalviorum]